MTTRISIIVHSYNRPRMLRECLASVRSGRPDQVLVADDGSTFDVAGLCAEFGAELVGLPPMTVDERLVSARQGGLINTALTLVTGDVVVNICDDDLHHPDWYGYLRAWFAKHPESDYVRGDWGVFDDGDMLGDRMCAFPDHRRATAGNFAYRTSLVRERGCAWPTGVQVNLDDQFLWTLSAYGIDVFRPVTVGFAGWRREHPAIAGGYATGYGFNHQRARAVLDREWCE